MQYLTNHEAGLFEIEFVSFFVSLELFVLIVIIIILFIS